jgi:hypothetical protein
VGLRHLYRVASVITLGLIMGLCAAACAAPEYTYVADSGDNAYFKVPPSWHPVSASSLESETGQSSSLGNYLWTRAYDASAKPSASHILASTAKPVAFASVISLSTSERSTLSLDGMRDLFLPVTSQARQAASADGDQLTGFQSISDQVVSNGSGYRGIREIFDYTFNNIPETFDLTVMTDSGTTKLYFLLVQCEETCFAASYPQISQVTGSFTVGGGS